MGKKEKRPTWFALSLDHGEILRSVDKTTGMDSILYALDYLESGKVPIIESPLTRGIFNILKKSVDETFERYNALVEAGRKGGNSRHQNTL